MTGSVRHCTTPQPERPFPSSRLLAPALLLITVAGCISDPGAGAAAARERASIQLGPCEEGGKTLCGKLEVFEDREAASGRKIALNIKVIPATEEPRKADPIFLLAGGPGQAATRLAGWAQWQWFRDPRRDLVLVDQRGTGESNGLRCDLQAGGRTDPLSALDSVFEDPGILERCRKKLERSADLSLYSTPLAMDDLEDVRRALGYDMINLVGGSYGSRAGLIYLRRHGEHVRAAVLWGPAPLSNTLPLHHPRSGQRALDQLLEQCAAEEECRKAFPDPRGELQAVLDRLERKPARVPVDGEGYDHVMLSRNGFAEALRIQMYSVAGGRRIPRLIHAAFQEDYASFVRASLPTVEGLIRQLDLGMLLSVVCAEDVPRIDQSRIEELTRGSFLGDVRVRAQIEICRPWPKRNLPGGYAEPVRSDRPVLVISGELDPVTPPEWGEEMVRHLVKGRHVAVARAHDVGSPCVGKFASAFLHGDPAAPLDTSCVEEMKLPEFER